MYILWGMVSVGQTPAGPRVHLVPTDTSVVDNVSDTSIETPLFLHRITNFNPSADLSDNTLFLSMTACVPTGRLPSLPSMRPMWTVL